MTANRTKLSRALLGAGLAVAVSIPVSAADIARGKRLHDERCLFCHGVENYSAPKSKMKSLADLQAMVKRWDGVARPAFTAAEREDVVAYLNAKFYKFDAPPKVGMRPVIYR